MTKVSADLGDVQTLILKYPSFSAEKLNNLIERKCEFYSKLDQEQLEMRGFEEGKRREYIEGIKDTILLTDLNYKEPKKVKKPKEEKKEEKPRELSEEEVKEIMKEAHENIIEILKKYCDLREEYYSLISTWILGTYLHKEFPTFPYLFLNAMRGSGKTRLLKLITHLSKQGEMLSSLTEAVLFRENNCLGIDEFEDLGRKGKENLKELLNSAYKQGGKVKRARKVKSMQGEEQEIETFDVYRPIVMANISGMENVLGDRCLKIALEKSNNILVTKRMELFDQDEKIAYTKNLLIPFESVGLCIVYTLYEVYKGWDKFIDLGFENVGTHLNTIHTLHNYTQLYTTIHTSELQGRELELSFPILILSHIIGEETFNSNLKTLKEIVKDKREDDVLENLDIQMYDFVSQEIETNEFVFVKELTRKFREFLQTEDEKVNSQWVGYCLKRLGLVRKRIRKNYGVSVILNVKKAQEKILMFK